MYREALKQLAQWKLSKNRKPLVLRGARQVGKTWLLKNFGAENYDKVVYLNLETNKTVSEIFQLDFDVKRIIRAIENLENIKINPNNTLLIFDEIQSEPRALTSLKYFCEDAPEYHIAVAGSLLGVSLHEQVSFPVGKVDFLDILPMSFAEFLLAINEPGLKKAIDGEIEDAIPFHDKIMEILGIYMMVGGMPEAVKTYVESGDFDATREVQRRIIDAYELDFSKHAPNVDVPKIRDIYNLAPTFLARENKRFIFGAVKESARGREYESALSWIENTGLATRVKRVNSAELPLIAHTIVNIFKLYLSDIGLLSAKMEIDARKFLTEPNAIGMFKGALAEQLVFQEMKTAGISSYYYSQDDSRSEIDFVIQINGEFVPIEVKAGENVKSVSFNNFINKWNLPIGVKFSSLPVRKNDKILNLPLYLASRVGKLLNKIMENR